MSNADNERSDVAADSRLRAANERVVVTRALGQTLRDLREAAGLSSAELARRCRISQFTVSKTELARREPRLSLIMILCAGLEISPDTLLAQLPIPQERGAA